VLFKLKGRKWHNCLFNDAPKMIRHTDEP